MKVGLTDIYRNYNSKLKERKAALAIDQESYEKTKVYLIEKLEEHKHYIRYFTNIDYKHIKDSDRCISERSLTKLADLQGVDINLIRRSINIIVQINRSLSSIKEELSEIEEYIVDEELFRDIIGSFNDLVSDAIVYEGYSFKLGGGLGVLKIKKVLCDTRIKKRVNWGESNKKKQEILSRGGIPFKVTERDTEGKPVANNGGEHWIVYWNLTHDYLWHWSKNRNIVYNSAYYRFDPTLYNNTSKGGTIGNVNKLAQLKQSNSPLLVNFA
jgi:hypothetical protein